MKKVVIALVVIIVLAVVLLALTSRSSWRLGAGTTISQEGQQMDQMTRHFLEDIQFKDFQKAASYHSREDRKKVNIPNLIERMFGIKPEFLDIMRYEIVKVQFDSSGKRCRVKTKTVVKILNTSEIREPEIIFYYFKDPAEGWVMELESSLH